MGIILFAIIGAEIEAGTAYWFFFGMYCVAKIIGAVID